MWNHAFRTVLYEVAVRTLPRVYLKERPGVYGVIVQKDQLAQTTQIHWGVSDGFPVQTWAPNDILCFVEEGK